MYSSLTDNIKNRWVMDWYLPEKKTCIEYFGLYSEHNLKRNTRVGKYSRKVIKKIDTCNKLGIKLISLYPQDLNDNFKGIIFKFAEHGIELKINSSNL